MKLLHSKRTKKRAALGFLRIFFYAFILVAILIPFSTLHIHFDYEQRAIPNVDRTRAVFLISMGRQAAESSIVERFVLSMRRRGNWHGYVVLLTDAPYDRYDNLQEEDGHVIVMHPKEQDFNWNTKHDMPYKRFKTQVLDYVDAEPRLDSVQLIYYLDVDIIAGNDLSNFFQDIEATYQISSESKLQQQRKAGGVALTTVQQNPNKDSNIYFFKGNFAKTPVQGGQIILERDSARGCLLFWRSMMDTYTNETKDQPFLKYIQEHNHNNTYKCHMTVMEQEPYLNFPSAATVAESNAKWPSRRHYPPLLHIKNTGKVRNIPDAAEGIFIRDVLNLYFPWDPYRELGQKMHFDPDESPWSPNHAATSTWKPTYAGTAKLAKPRTRNLRKT